MDDIIKALEKLGITARILVFMIGIWILFSIYKNYLDTKKIQLEIVEILKRNNQSNQYNNNQPS